MFEPNWLGDVIFTTPAFKAIKNNFKDCFIGCVVSKSCAGVLHNNPFVDEIIEFNERGEDRSLRKKILFIQKLKSKKYDMVILLHRSFTRALLMFLAGIKIRIGYASKKRSCLLTKKIPPLNINIIHKQDYYLRILEKIGIKVEDKNCQAHPSLKERNWADNILRERACGFDYLIAINP
ncbi:MAG: glycosyltransferase family 9 protein, partial [Candidatus Omnitrophica bacterium]|nr:glycosyltransferase family 9 protein [Candidatus Omnitrophota bacterium]